MYLEYLITFHEQLLNFSSIPKWQTSMARLRNKFMEMRSATSDMQRSILLDQQIAWRSAEHLHEICGTAAFTKMKQRQ